MRTDEIARETAVFDTSFWIHTYGVGLVTAVRARYVLRHPPAVAAELPLGYASGREFWRLVRTGALTEVEVGAGSETRFSPGERAAINVALEHPEWVLLLDDRRPYEEAERLDLRVLCSPLLIVALDRDGAIDRPETARLLVALSDLGSLSPRLVRLGVAGLARERAAHGGA